jgi:hypothetical protein
MIGFLSGGFRVGAQSRRQAGIAVFRPHCCRSPQPRRFHCRFAGIRPVFVTVFRSAAFRLGAAGLTSTRRFEFRGLSYIPEKPDESEGKSSPAEAPPD